MWYCKQTKLMPYPLLTTPQVRAMMIVILQNGPSTDPSYLDGLLAWVSSSSAAATSFVLNVISLILAIVGFVLYFGQKREYKLLFGILQEYGLKEKVSADAKSAKAQHALAQEELTKAKAEIRSAQQELAERIPKEARRVYFENTIPVVHKQIFDLSQQLRQLTDEYEALGGNTSGLAPQIEEVLSEEVRKHVSVRRDMERSEAFLAILTGTTASIGIIAPFPFNWIALPFAVLALIEAFRLFRLWRLYYRTRSASTS
jgi:hypothetical protein